MPGINTTQSVPTGEWQVESDRDPHTGRSVFSIAFVADHKNALLVCGLPLASLRQLNDATGRWLAPSVEAGLATLTREELDSLAVAVRAEVESRSYTADHPRDCCGGLSEFATADGTPAPF